MNKTHQVAILALVIGGALGYSASHWFSMSGHNMSDMSSAAQESNKPLYWVAPMDPNYQRDQPGKSPMGMDLIPVYAEDLAGGNDKPGTVTIDPAVENNLGVKTALVQKEALSPRIETVGYVAFDESLLWQTNVRVAGWVEKLNVNAVGDHVKRGDTLFTLYSPELVKAQEELLNAYRSGRKGLVQGASERLMTLGVDKGQIDSIKRRGRVVQNIAVKAPANGVIASLNVREGGYLSPAQAAISAGPLAEVWVDAEVFERQSHWIESGSLATMTLDAIPGKEWQGEVDYVYPILDPKTRTLRVRLKFDNPMGELKPNMFANIALRPQTSEQVLTIPRSSVIRSGGMTRVVLSEGEGKYRSARIEVGREAGERIEVTQGLSLEDKVVTSAHFMLDSESSQSADLERINGVEVPAETVWAKGEITDVMPDHAMLTINHQPVPEWDWPGMVMNFNLAEDVTSEGLESGQAIEFEMKKTPDGMYEIVELKVDQTPVINQVWVRGDITMLMADFGMITLSHDAVDVWGWSAGEMNFTADPSVDLTDYVEAQSVEFLVEKQGSDYVLKAIKKGEGEQ
ncbi:efflux RND transporter periplasmic adaptor subunit [Vibrio astriarenae]|uniref:Efflux RND transporter periplasmic adaptor subunit n=1 Tax=Vibrio astriarenae TaxID=1481923 RepID=A0A7Z2T3F4_9VIBR|nr:efflux RND transporter periplasmic adaptor subunit [Vibrio astriarenae]QIA63555.1 efflux RND transporter periplasmic adaptor subunit [Vibrio astriarenae]